MFWKQRSLSLPHPSPSPASSSSSSPFLPPASPLLARYSTFVDTTRAYIAVKLSLAHPIFSVSGISVPRGDGGCGGGGWGRGEGKTRGLQRRCSASFFNYVQPPLGRAALRRTLHTPRLFRPPSTFLVELAALPLPFLTPSPYPPPPF